MLDSADVSNDPLTAAISLANDPLPQKLFKLLAALSQI